ncbi:hypothetical protein ON010_g14963 [Phytophthora cinnamomi]|nr:hypothetical protein ON010_g14963 [Phytophthora cinnamomi]
MRTNSDISLGLRIASGDDVQVGEDVPQRSFEIVRAAENSEVDDETPARSYGGDIEEETVGDAELVSTGSTLKMPDWSLARDSNVSTPFGSTNCITSNGRQGHESSTWALRT